MSKQFYSKQFTLAHSLSTQFLFQNTVLFPTIQFSLVLFDP